MFSTTGLFPSLTMGNKVYNQLDYKDNLPFQSSSYMNKVQKESYYEKVLECQ
jgi:hypothetical protein